MPAGRPSIITPEVIEAICDRLADGESMVAICRDADMPSLRTAMTWAADNAAFRTEYMRAREAQAEVMDEMILSAARDAGEDSQAARVRIEAYKWRAAKLAPKRYSDRMTHAGDPDQPVQIAHIRRTVVDPRDLG
jgi:hypothetical protein